MYYGLKVKISNFEKFSFLISFSLPAIFKIRYFHPIGLNRKSALDQKLLLQSLEHNYQLTKFQASISKIVGGDLKVVFRIIVIKICMRNVIQISKCNKFGSIIVRSNTFLSLKIVTL